MEHVFITWEVLEQTLFKADLDVLQAHRMQTFSASVQLVYMQYGGTPMRWSWVVNLMDSKELFTFYPIIMTYREVFFLFESERFLIHYPRI